MKEKCIVMLLAILVTSMVSVQTVNAQELKREESLAS